MSRGLAYLKLFQYKDAISDFTACLQRDPTNMAAYQNRGFAREQNGDPLGG